MFEQTKLGMCPTKNDDIRDGKRALAIVGQQKKQNRYVAAGIPQFKYHHFRYLLPRTAGCWHKIRHGWGCSSQGLVLNLGLSKDRVAQNLMLHEVHQCYTSSFPQE